MAVLVPHVHRPFQTAHRRGRDEQRPGAGGLLAGQLGYALRDLWRTRIAFIFTFLFPLTFLVVIGALVGDTTVAADSDVRVMQFVTPSAAIMGALYGAFPTVASSLAEARERGVLKRMRGTPLPGWIYLAGRIGAAVVMAAGSLALMLTVGVVGYDVQIQWDTMPATITHLVFGVTSFAAAGVAVSGLVRSASLAQSVSIALAVVLSFLSGLMGYGVMPTWVNRIADLFPIKHLNDSLITQFDPYTSGPGWELGSLALVAGWAIGAIALAVLVFRWEPAPVGGRLHGGSASSRRANAAAVPAPGSVQATEVGRPSTAALLLGQARWATKSALMNLGWVFFAIAMPVALYAFNAAVKVEGAGGLDPTVARELAMGMVAWGAIVTGMVNLPDAIARARDLGVLKRLRGTPLQISLYFTGRLASALMLVFVTGALVLISGIVWFDLELRWAGLPLAAGLLLLGTATLTACGLLLVSVLPNSRSVTAVGLGVALPISFFSDVFVVEEVPGWMETVGSLMPLKHLANSLSASLDPAGSTLNWVSVAVMVSWLVVAAVVAVRLFRWSPRD